MALPHFRGQFSASALKRTVPPGQISHPVTIAVWSTSGMSFFIQFESNTRVRDCRFKLRTRVLASRWYGQGLFSSTKWMRSSSRTPDGALARTKRGHRPGTTALPMRGSATPWDWSAIHTSKLIATGGWFQLVISSGSLANFLDYFEPSTNAKHIFKRHLSATRTWVNARGLHSYQILTKFKKEHFYWKNNHWNEQQKWQ